ncbi:transposase [Clostridium tagluense]|uniref:transposase n=2 Tax=Clostridium TaxID=1485 RepID=UPI0013E8F7CD|nr:transposase [Clostridium tagluense]MBW9158034.1 transposase [Clostridium tagluense]WLC66462.1 transposase [Clostridium tagluense]
MAKKKLTWYLRAMYHVTSRGNRRSDIFKDEDDYLTYLDVLKEAIEYYKNSHEVIAYALRTNHVHLQIKTKDNHIWQLMSRINKNYKGSSYSVYLGKKKENIVRSETLLISDFLSHHYILPGVT